jgi:hypothetical protein
MRFAITSTVDHLYWTGTSWSKNHQDAKVYKTMRVREVCEKLHQKAQSPLVCVNLDNGQWFY